MATKPLSDALLQEAVNAVADHGSEAAAAKAMAIPRSTLKDRVVAAKAKGVKPNGKRVDKKDPQVLEDQVRRLTAELKAAERTQSDVEVVKGLIGTLDRKLGELDPPDFLLSPQAKASAPGVPTLMLSDLHWGEVVQPAQINHVNDYNVRIAHERMDTCINAAVHLLRILSPKLDYPGIVLPLGGDMISGNIHDELTATNELNTMPTVLDLYGVLTGVISTMADTFKHVFLPCVSGNHGRDTHKIWNKDRHATSFDWLLYQFLAKRFENDKRVTFLIPDGPDAYYKVYDHAYLLTHGDQFRGGDGMIGCLGPILRGDHKKRSRNGQVDMEYDTMLMGHWHQYIHHGRVIVNGSLKGYDEYAYNNNFGFERPQQALWMTHPAHGQTYRMPVYVDKKRGPKETKWVQVPRWQTLNIHAKPETHQWQMDSIL